MYSSHSVQKIFSFVGRFFLCDLTWNGMEWNEMELNGSEWNGMEWNGIEWNVMECNIVPGHGAFLAVTLSPNAPREVWSLDNSFSK